MTFSNADWAHMQSPHYIYIASDAAAQVLYVGCSFNPAQRIAAHRRTKWLPLTTCIDIWGPFEKDEALEHEREAIWNLQPAYNRRGKDRRSDALQWADAIWDGMYGERAS